MTGKAYYEKYRETAKTVNDKIERIQSGDIDVTRDQFAADLGEMINAILDDMLIEMQQLGEQRRVSTVDALESIVKDMDRRWNKMRDLFEKEFGDPLLTDNGFSKFYIQHIKKDIDE